MGKTLTVGLATLFVVVGLAGFASSAGAAEKKGTAATQSCEQKCANYAGGTRDRIYSRCVEKCKQK